MTGWFGPSLPVTVMEKTPAGTELGTETFKMEEAEPPETSRSVRGLIETIGPPGFTPSCRFTLPESPLTLVTVMVEFAEDPSGTARNIGFAETKKSGWVFTKT